MADDRTVPGVAGEGPEGRREAARQPTESDAVLVPVPGGGDNTFLVLAEEWDADAIPLDRAFMLSDAARADLADRVAQGTGLVNVGLQGLNGMQSVQGLVRLAPETLRLMQAGATPLTSGGANLGTLSAGGKIVAQIRWTPAVGASAVGILAALGPAIALAAIQFQLAAMSKKLDQIIEINDEILRTIRVEFWTDVETTFTRLKGLWNHAIYLGTVSSHLMDEARGRSWVLSHRRAQLLEDVAVRIAELNRHKGASDRNKWLAKNTGELMRDLQCLVLASAGCQMYDLMWAQYVSQSDPHLAGRIMDDAQITAATDKRTISSAVTMLNRQLELLAQSPGSERFYLLGLDSEPEKVLASAKRLGAAVAELGIPIEDPLMGQSTVKKLTSGTDGWQAGHKALSTIKWHLLPGETLSETWVGKASFLCITNMRAFSCHRKRPQEVRWMINWADVSRVKAFKDYGDHNIEIKLKNGRAHRFEIGPGDESATVAIAQARQLELVALAQTEAPGWTQVTG